MAEKSDGEHEDTDCTQSDRKAGEVGNVAYERGTNKEARVSEGGYGGDGDSGRHTGDFSGCTKKNRDNIGSTQSDQQAADNR